MSPHRPGESDAELTELYRQASATASVTTSIATREAILADGRRIAAERAASSVQHRFDAKQPAANQPRWRLAAFGTLSAALLAVVLMLPRYPSSTGPAPTAPRAESVTRLQSAAPAHVPGAAPPVSPAPPPLAVAPRPAGKSLASPAPQRFADASHAQAASENQAARSGGAPAYGRRTQQLVAASAASATVSAAPAAQPAGAPTVPSSGLGANALTAAVAGGDLVRATQLLNQGIGSEQLDAQGRSPLMLAVIANRADMIRLLLARGANPNAADRTGETPLQRAQRDARPDLVTLLQNPGAPIRR